MGKTDDWVHQANIVRFRQKIAEAKSPAERATLQRLLDAERAKSIGPAQADGR